MAYLRTYRFEIILLGILLLAGYLRFIGIIDGLFAFTYDVGRDMIEVGKIVYDGNIPFIGPTTGLPGLFYGPWWYYLLVPSFFIGAGNPQIVAGFLALLGLICCITGYIIGKELGERGYGVVFAAVVGFSPVMIALSVQIWNPNIAPVYLLLIMLVLMQFVTENKTTQKSNNTRYHVLTILLGILAGFSIDAEVVYGLLLTVGLGIFLIAFVWKRELWRVGFFMLGLLGVFAPRILFELKNNFIMTRTILSHNGDGSGPVAGISLDQTQKSFIVLKTLWDETIAVSHEYLGWILLLMTVVLLIRSFRDFSQTAKLFVTYCCVTLLVFFIGLSFFRDALWGHYIVGLPVVFIFLFTYSLYTLIPLKRFRPVVLAGLLIYLLFIIRPQAYIARYTEPMWVGDASVYRNQLAVVDYIYKTADGQQYNYLVYTPAVHDYPYRYLFSWYGKKAHGYPASVNTEPLLFVIIEPDNGFEARQQEWLRLRQNDGTIRNETRFPSGITVQTRRRE